MEEGRSGYSREIQGGLVSRKQILYSVCVREEWSKAILPAQEEVSSAYCISQIRRTCKKQPPQSEPTAFGAFGAVTLARTSHHKQLPCLTLRVSHRAWIEPGEWLSTTKLQSKRSNPNARRQMGVRNFNREAAPLPPNHGGDGFLT